MLEPLGEGGQGSVWKAEDRLQPGRLRALKLVPLANCRPSDVERMRREARVLATLDSPSLVVCHGLFEDLKHEVLGLSMEYIQGSSLRSVLRDPRTTNRHRLWVLRHVARALAYIHDQELVHRDLKPENVLVTEGFWEQPEQAANVKLVDFGIAAAAGNPNPLTAQNSVIGTVAYLAPELLDPAAFPGPASAPTVDIFAFGVLGFTVLTAAHPSGLGEHATAIQYCLEYRRAERVSWPTLRIGGPWGELLTRCLSLRASERVASGQELARICDHLPDQDGFSLSQAAPVPDLPHAVTVIASPGAIHGTPPNGAAIVNASAPNGAAFVYATAPTQAVDRAVFERSTVRDAGVGALGAANDRHVRGDGQPNAAHGSERSDPSLSAPGPAKGRRAGLLAAVGALALLVGLAAGVALKLLRSPNPEPSASATAPSAAAPAAIAAPSAAPSAVTEPLADAGVLLPTRPESCAEDAGLCDCCPSGRDCGEQGCAAALPEDASFRVRFARAESAGGYPVAEGTGTRLCVRPLTLDSEWRCAELSRSKTSELTVAVRELTRTGLDVKVEQSSRPGVDARSRYRQELTRAALCQGVNITHFAGELQIEAVQLFLEEAEDAGVVHDPCL